MADIDTKSRTKVIPKVARPPLHKVILVNDDFTPRDFVVMVLKAEFRMPEAQALTLKPGQKVTAALQADATRTFAGKLAEILPQVNANSRTLQARFEVDNRTGQLTPGMLLRVQVAGVATSRLLVPAEAVIRTGTRAVVIVRKGDGSFEPRDVKLGAELGEQFEVVQGLSEGEQVVASGQFLVDSEARLRSVLGGMAASAPQGGAQ